MTHAMPAPRAHTQGRACGAGPRNDDVNAPNDCTLYGSRGSGSAAVEVALRRAGLRYRTVRASTWEPDSAQDELRRVNPLQQIPTLVLPDGSVLTESAAILMTLADICPDSGLLPPGGPARAQAQRGLVFIAANCYGAIGVGDYPERWTTARDEAAHEAVRQGARRQLHRAWDVFADQFGRLLITQGQTPTALDILAAVVSKWSGTRAHLRKQRPGMAAALERIDKHSTVAPVFAEHWET